jgi:type IV pilus assembly protein PilV
MKRSKRPHCVAKPSNRPAVAGFALLEVLVGLLIFMFGVLGLIGLQAGMTQAQSISKVRTDAAYLARELLGRMWTDMPNRTLYTTANCSGHALCKDWTDKVARSLPSGTSNVNFDAATGDVVIVLGWSVPDGGTHSYTTRSTVLPSE